MTIRRSNKKLLTKSFEQKHPNSCLLLLCLMLFNSHLIIIAMSLYDIIEGPYIRRPSLSSPGSTQGPGGLLLRITKLLSEQVRQDEELSADSQVKHEEWQSTRKE